MNKVQDRERKKIMFLITGSELGGAEVIVKNIIFNLDQTKFIPIFVSIRPLGTIGKEINRRCKVFSAQAENKFSILFLFRLYHIIYTEKPDILHCHLFHANFLGRIIGKILKIPFIISTIHSDNFGGRFRYFLLQITDPLTNITIAVSQKIKDDLIKHNIITKNKIKLIYNGVNNSNNLITSNDINNLKKSLKIENYHPIILSVGRLNSVKGHIYLIRAIKLVINQYPNLRLILIGNGPERVNLEAEVLNLNLSNNIIFLGEIRKLSIYYKLADFFILPSLNEGFGLAVVEAMSNGLLVIASRVGGIPEIIHDSVNGFTFNPKDVFDLSKVMRKVFYLKREQKKSFIYNAYKDFEDNFSLEKMIDNYYRLYLF